MPSNTILAVRNLSVDYTSARGPVKAVRDISFDLAQGETLAIIGESGCGKTTLALALNRLLPKAARIIQGSITYYDTKRSAIDVLKLSTGQLRAYRWRDCAMVFQSALNALNPVLRIRAQVQDTAWAHGERNVKKVEERAKSLFEAVRLDPERVYDAYPHELSGGMRQRVLIALGVLLNPRIVFLDEPTTALDVLTQRTVIEVLKQLREKFGFSLVFISHDLSMAAELATRLMTMYAGQVVELGEVNSVFYAPQHPYTLGLLRAAPVLTGPRDELSSIPGAPPDLINLKPGCKFAPRCPYVTEECKVAEPPLEVHALPSQLDNLAGGDIRQASACYHWDLPSQERATYRAALKSVGKEHRS